MTTSSKINHKNDIIQRLGGVSQYEMILDDFCQRIRNDHRLSSLFGDFEPENLRALQNMVFDTSFLQVGSEARKAAEARTLLYHFRLFQNGLGERHFDRMLNRLIDVLRVACVKQDVIFAFAGHYESMRGVFGGTTPTPTKYAPSTPEAERKTVPRKPILKKTKDDMVLSSRADPSSGAKSGLRRVLSGENLLSFFGTRAKSKTNLLTAQ